MKFWLRQSVLSEAHSKQEQLTQHNVIFEFLQTVEKKLDHFPHEDKLFENWKISCFVAHFSSFQNQSKPHFIIFCS